ncbi:NRT1/ PTR FAMILY 1.1 [Thalictrum thalictroides]|uniref:NRT1/ PTR FAMILY 1.1 n=1 Tax=Thalictrum thalictroides TaxID=46969 RepID=A0A7J6WMJ5_THATH|nr:NRT1/ PTR FAMILY 1.1 [Thalictrum thalictroides]
MEGIVVEEKMEVFSIENKTTCNVPSKPKGGLVTMPFIIANESLEKVVSMGLHSNMIFYLMKGYHMSNANGTSILQLWSALSNFLPVLGAFLSDSYFGRFQVVVFGSVSSFLGVILLWLTTMIPQAKPPASEEPNSSQLALLFSSFLLMSIGAGGVRPCSIAFGADQFITNKDNPNNERILQTYFNWYYASVGLSFVIAVTVLVYIQDHFGWKWGFGIPVILMSLSILTFFLGSHLYVKVNANKSLFTGLVQVIAVTFKNRSLPYPANCKYHCSKGSDIVLPSQNLRLLNKACVIMDPENDINPDGSTSKPWNLCTVEQVQALKSLIRILPIWSTGIISYLIFTMISFGALQAKSMDRHLTSNFQIPPASYGVFGILTITIWASTYDRLVVPLLAKFTGNPRGITNQARMGIGLLLTAVAMVLGALVENIRRSKAIAEGLADKNGGIVGMSAFWLVPQHCAIGLAEAFQAVGQIEFFYSQLPKNMASLAMALCALNNAVAGLLGSFLVKTVDRITKHGGKQSWVASNPNKGHFDYFYLLVAILCAANFLYYLLCCWAYGFSDEVKRSTSDDQEDISPSRD